MLQEKVVFQLVTEVVSEVSMLFSVMRKPAELAGGMYSRRTDDKFRAQELRLRRQKYDTDGGANYFGQRTVSQ